MNSLLQGRCLLKPSILRARSLCSWADESPITYRDLFVIEDSWEESKWKASIQSEVNLKHPSSSHIISKYSTYQFNNGDFHFNSLGEFSLSIAGAHLIKSSISKSAVDMADIDDKSHSCYIWPDRVWVHNASLKDIGPIMDSTMNPKKMINNIELKKLILQNDPLSQAVVTDYSNGITVLGTYRSISKNINTNTDINMNDMKIENERTFVTISAVLRSFDSVLRTMTRFTDMTASSSSTLPLPVKLLMSTDTRGHRKGSHNHITVFGAKAASEQEENFPLHILDENGHDESLSLADVHIPVPLPVSVSVPEPIDEDADDVDMIKTKNLLKKLIMS